MTQNEMVSPQTWGEMIGQVLVMEDPVVFLHENQRLIATPVQSLMMKWEGKLRVVRHIRQVVCWVV